MNVQLQKRMEINSLKCNLIFRLVCLSSIFCLFAINNAVAQKTFGTRNILSFVPGDPVEGSGGGVSLCDKRPESPQFTVNQPLCGEPNGSITITNFDSQNIYQFMIQNPEIYDSSGPTINLKEGNTYYVNARNKTTLCPSGYIEVIIRNSTIQLIQNVSTQPYLINLINPSVSLNLIAQGDNLSYQWFKTNDKALPGIPIANQTDGNYIPDASILGTSYYYAIVSGNCQTIKSNVATVVVKTAVVTGNITRMGASINCPGTGYVSLTLDATTVDGAPDPSFQWEWSYCNDVYYTIPSANSDVYVTSGLDFTRYYHVKITSNDPLNPYTNFTDPIMIKVKLATHILHDIAGTYTISNQYPPYLNLGVYGDNLHYQWFQNSVESNTGGTPITNTDGSIFLANIMNEGTFYYYVIVTGDCGPQTSGVAKVIVNKHATPGTITGANAVCSGTNNTTLTLNQYLGTIQWQSSTDNINFVNITGATSATYSAVNVATSTWYRAVVTNSNTATSESVSITVNSPTTIIQDLNVQPYSTAVNGRTVVLSVVASGSNLTYQWYLKNGGTSTPVTSGSGGQTAAFTPDISSVGTTQYFVSVIGSCGQVNSKVATVIISPQIIPDASGIVYITLSGSGNKSGNSWANASNYIQNAINTPNVKQVWVAAGTYKPDIGGANVSGDRNASFILQNNLSIYGGFAGTETLLTQRDSTRATNNTILSGDIGTVGVNTDNAYHVVVSAGIVGSATLNGFTVKGGYANGGGSIVVNGITIGGGSGGGIVINSSAPVISNLSIVGNYANDAGGLYNYNASPVLNNIIINSNTVPGYGGGLYNNTSFPNISNTIISGNSANALGGAMCNYGSSPVFTNVLISGNFAAGGGGGIFNTNSSTPVLINVTISGNKINSGSGAGIYSESNSNSQIRNSIIYGNKDGIANDGTSVPLIRYSLVQGGLQSGIGNIDGSTQDPLFVSPVGYASSPTTTGNYRLQSTSPAINKGNDPDNLAINDLDGNTRKVGVIDMGAYENNGCPSGNVFYVKANATGTYNGSSWANAFTNLQDALSSVCMNVTQVWVASGTYKPNSRADNMSNANANDRNNAFVLKNNLKIYGGFAGTETLLTQRDSTRSTNNTILSGDIGAAGDNTDNAYHVVVSAGAGTAELNGFTIRDGNADGSGSVIIVSSQNLGTNTGGGIFNAGSSPIIKNVTITENTAIENGGGIFNISSSPAFTNVVINGSHASWGGGIYNWSSSPVFTNVVLSGNTASNRGGGIFNNYTSSPVLTNVTISGNLSSGGGGISNDNSSSPLIRNTIIYGNSDGIFNSDVNSVPVISYSLVQGLTAETNGNVSGTKDPLFVNPVSPGLSTDGDYRLQNSGSPAYNSGNNIYFNVGQNPDLSAITRDLDGNPRKTGIIDLGPYELLSALPVSLINFTAQQAGSQSKLTWSTTREVNNKSFIISRSADGSNFTEIGKVNAQGNSVNQNDYVFYDQSPLRGNNYYKMEQVDNDGRKTLAGIRLVNFTKAGSINLYPNPVRNNLVVEFAEGLYDHIQLTDISGRVLKVFVPGKTNSRQEINMSNLASGPYFLVFIGNDKMETRKVVKE